MGSLHARVLSQSDRCDLVRVAEPREEVGRSVADVSRLDRRRV
jgi:hypothetical protein